MKTLKKTNIIISVVTFAALLIVSYSLSTINSNNLINFFTATDTLDNPPAITIPADVSGMFNERGFYKSNSFSYDENEIINDYNGNLQYSFPLYSLKGHGDLYIDLRLNYNGSVNYVVNAASDYNISLNRMPQYNISAPGWIFSLNGMAVQMLNFETNFFTRPSSPTGTDVENDEIRLLATGYQITDKLQPAEESHPNELYIMMGDGSVLSLRRIPTIPSGGTNEENNYVGDYYSNNKKNYVRARVEYLDGEQGIWPSYRNRRVSVMKGDGLTYVYEERKIAYYDFPVNAIASMHFRPQVLLLTKIKDKFGHVILLDYTTTIEAYMGTSSVKGRPLIKSIYGIGPKWPGASIYFNYYSLSTQSLVHIACSDKGRYKIYCTGFNLDEQGVHKSYVNKIVSPYNDELNITHTGYRRIANNLFNPNSGSSYNMNLKFDAYVTSNLPIKRITEVINYNGGKKTYIYADSNSTLSIDMNPQGYEYKIQSSSDDYFRGQGRDMFYVNMMGQKKTHEETTLVKTEYYTYPYYDDSNDRETDPNDESDSCFSIITNSAASSEYSYETPTQKITKKYYANFKTYTPYLAQQNPDCPANPDWPGETKLIWEKFYLTDEDNLYKRIDYKFEKGGGGPVYLGSFLDTNITETINGVSRTTSYRFEHSSEPDYTNRNQADNPISKRIEFDPLRRSTETSYFIFYDSSANYLYGFYRSEPGVQNLLSDTTFVYQFNLPTNVLIKNPSENLIYKESSYYLLDNSDTGYIGQIKWKRVYDINNQNNYTETQYKYFIKDTLGQYLYGTMTSKPSTEGNLKEIVDPKGNKTCYYYHPVRLSDGEPFIIHEDADTTDGPWGCCPKISYVRIYDDGFIDTVKSYWEDWRLPVRIDNYPTQNQYLSHYLLYDITGNVKTDVSYHGYGSEFVYDALDRISTATLPYDFSHDTDYTYILYDTLFIPFEYTSVSSGWGYINDLNTSDNDYKTDVCDLFSSNFSIVCEIAGGPDADPQDIKKSIMIGFSDTTLTNLYDIDYAYLEFWPWYNEHEINDDTSNTKWGIKIRPFNPANFQYGTGSQTLQNLNITEVWSTSCIEANAYATHSSNYNIYDIKQLVKDNTSNGLISLKGLHLEGIPIGNYGDPPKQHIWVPFVLSCNCYGYFDWGTNFAPRIKIKGTYRYITSQTFTVYSSSTLHNSYDDENNRVSSMYKIDNSKRKVIDNFFDGFYRLKQTDIYTSTNSSNSFYTNYNYLDQKAKVTDARNNSTKYSYNEYGTLSKTENADNSASLVSEGYYSSLTTHWGTYNGFIHKQVYEDETGRKFEKYFDPVGNLLRETKFLDNPGEIDPDNPYDQDTADNPGYDNPPTQQSLCTDYKYDNMYRVTDVYTPNEKTISYIYDGYGRQIRRTTPDAGITKYSYDKNNNLIYSQDENQRHISSGHSTFRTYDGVNRLTVLGFVNLNVRDVPEDELPDEELDVPGSADSLVLVNVYDTLTNAVVSLFNSPPSGYNNIAKNTKGNLVATAYRTRLGDNWNYKYYQYDARGRVIKLWHYIDGLGWKVINNAYNSLNQLTYLNYNPGVSGESKLFKYSYDDAARLNDVSYYVGQNPVPDEIEGDFPGDYQNFTSYTYNENSQVATHRFNDNGLIANYSYNNRNWISSFYDNQGKFQYNLSYNLNGNIRRMNMTGLYKLNFGNIVPLGTKYIYDKSNRLLRTDDSIQALSSYDLIMTYDKDGNILTMKRYGSSNNLVDDYTYSYISGTNKLSKTGGLADQYTYDYNGNMTSDDINRNGTFKYDHRNLLIEFRHISPGSGGVANVDTLFQIKYYYDEAGNRIRKIRWKYIGAEPDPEFESDSPYWQLVQNEFYVRDVNGKEIAIYDNTNLDQWNVWGLDNVGKINSDDSRNFYLKDHLGSIRAIVNESYTIISAQDYDAWGYLMENRSYTSNKSKYKFTNKERDYESNYDYFGARYYDSRIGNWTSVDPLFEKHIGWTPYNYVLRNPLIFYDPNGKQELFMTRNYMYEFGGAVMGGVAGYAVAKLWEQVSPGVYNLIKPIQEIVVDATRETYDMIEEAILGPTYSSGKEKGIESQVEQIEEHIGKIGNINPDNPDPNNMRDKWKKDITKALKEAHKDFKQAFRKIKNKNYKEYMEKTFGKERMQRIYDKLKDEGIDFYETAQKP